MPELPALDPATLEEKGGSTYPEPYRSRVAGRTRRRLAPALELTKLGVNLTTLAPGAQSALRHWHTQDDEFVYVLEGEVVLVTDDGEQTLRAGMCAGYPAASRDGHHFINRSAKPVRYLEVSSKVPGDTAFYPDDDLFLLETEDGRVMAHKDGRRY
jgi:uncharacterized cupin superfamily protein